MKKQIILYIILVFVVLANSQTIPKSINKPAASQKPSKAGVIKKEVKKGGEKSWKKKYDYVREFSEGLHCVDLNGKYGFVDQAGQIVISLKYDGALGFHEGLAWVKLGDKWGFINKTEEVVIPIKYDCDYGYDTKFEDGLADVTLNGKVGVINRENVEVIPFKYDYVFKLTKGLFRVVLDHQYGVIDKTIEL